MIDKYTKSVLTVIAAALVCIAIQLTISPADAERFGTPVMIGGISSGAAECLAGHLTYTGGDTGNCIAAW